MKKVLVTGGTGFIGSTLVGHLVQAGVRPKVLMRRTSTTENLGHSSYERVEGDLSDIESLRKAVRDVDTVYHLAGITAAKDRKTYFRMNAEGTALLAQAVAEANPELKKFIYVSSLAAAGPAKSLEPREESQSETPISAYGESKLAGEKELLKYKDRIPSVIVRPPMVFGPKDVDVFLFIQTVNRRLMPLLRGRTESGQKYYSVVHSEDLCRGLVEIGQAPDPLIKSGEIFYLSADGLYTYENIMRTIQKILGRKALVIPVPDSFVRALGKAALVASRISGGAGALNADKIPEILADYWICSNEKIKKTFGFSPKFDLESGMSDAIAWYKKEKWI